MSPGCSQKSGLPPGHRQSQAGRDQQLAHPTGSAGRLTRFAVSRLGKESLAPHSPGRLPTRALLFRSRTPRRRIITQPGGSVLLTGEWHYIVHSLTLQVPVCSMATAQSFLLLINACMRTGLCKNTNQAMSRHDVSSIARAPEHRVRIPGQVVDAQAERGQVCHAGVLGWQRPSELVGGQVQLCQSLVPCE